MTTMDKAGIGIAIAVVAIALGITSVSGPSAVDIAPTIEKTTSTLQETTKEI